MLGLVLWLGTLLLLLVGLIVGLSVVRNIFDEGKERYRSGGTKESEETGARGPAGAPGESGQSVAGADPSVNATSGEAAEIVVCNACNTRNDASYTYCQECTQRL